MMFALGALAVKPADAPETITIDGAAAKQAAVEFPHQLHFDLTECTTCHHTQEVAKDADLEVETCTSCHLNPAEATTPDMAQMSLKKNPFHLKCVACHKTEKKGPTKCMECHPKK